MDRFEMTEKLRERAQVSYEEARAALEQNNWDLVDAIVYLENKGQLKQEMPQHRVEEQRAQEHKAAPKPKVEGNVIETVIAFVGRLIEKGNRNHVEIYRNGDRIAKPSLLVSLLLILIFPWILVPGFIIALVLGCSFRMSGPDMPVKAKAGEQPVAE